jgi:serine/threonine-protein kinase
LNPEPVDSELESVLADYLAADAAGLAPDREELLRRHPALAEELKGFFLGHDQMRRVTAPVRQVLVATRATASRAAVAPALSPGRTVGAYELLEELGRGGMGVVFKARHAGLGRLVAIKMILAGELASPAEVRRLRAEAEAVAALDHPNIVPLYEVGEEDGQPYFAMKLIAGTTLTARVPEFRKDPAAAARLLATLARAVHHAHERGILHRDLKPANVLLDAEGRPYLTDFGLARRLGGSGSTRTAVAAGTPSYIAPEQASGPPHAVTTAADVYGLGAILYELLTGRPPFRGPTSLDVLRQLLHEEPQRPRASSPAVPRDLETVCLKCLEKDPLRRYSSALALAGDLEAFARGEPIQARPIGGLERFGRWCRRQPVVAGLTLALAASLLAGLGASLALWRQAERNYRLSEQRLEEVELERSRKEGSFRQAHRAVSDFNALLGENLQGLPGTQPLRKKTLDLTRRYLEEFLKRHGETAALRADLADARLQLAHVLHALGANRPALEEARKAKLLFADLLHEDGRNAALRRKLGEAQGLTAVLHAELGESALALEGYRQAVASYEEAGRVDTDAPATRSALALVTNNLGSLHRNAGRLNDARLEWEKSFGLYSRLVREQPGSVRFRMGLARVLHNLAVLHFDEGRTSQALEASKQSCEIQKRLLKEFPQSLDFRHGLAVELHHLAMTLGAAGDRAAARKADREALDLREKLARENPDVTDYQVALAASCMSYGVRESESGRKGEAMRWFRRAEAILKGQVRRDPTRVQAQLDLSRSEFRIGVQLAGDRQRAEAIEAYRASCQVAAKLVRASPDFLDAREQLAQGLNNLSLLLSEEGNQDEARKTILQAIEQGRHLAGAAPSVPRHRQRLAVFFAVLGIVERKAGRLGAAADALAERVRVWPGDGTELIQTTAEYALLAAAAGGDERRRYIDQAFATLRRALEAGYPDLARLRRAPSLEVLRREPRFEAILQEHKR